MLNKLHGQPDSYDRKFVFPHPAHFEHILNVPIADLDTASERHWALEHTVLSEKLTVPRARSP